MIRLIYFYSLLKNREAKISHQQTGTDNREN